jgi:hypothetical protein
MTPDEVATLLYLEHLTDHDLTVLCRSERDDLGPRELRGLVRSRRGGVEGFLASPDLFGTVLGGGPSREVLRVSPFLVFAVAVERAARELASARSVPEWAGPGRRTLVLDVARLREFVSSPLRRFFLAQLLGSYARVASGSVLVATSRGWRRRRFSELDPVQLAGLLEVVGPGERPGVLRRLGDLALFLTSVFPDHVARQGFGPLDRARLLRAGTGMPGAGVDRGRAARDALGGEEAVGLLAALGRRWYGAAADLLEHPLPADVAVIEQVHERFDDARRALGLVADRFLFPRRDQWFGLPSA